VSAALGAMSNYQASAVYLSYSLPFDWGARMFSWLFGRRDKNEPLLREMVKAAAEGANIVKLRQAIATISAEQLTGDESEMAATAASILTKKLAKSANIGMLDDDGLFTSGIFAFVFANHFSRVLAGQFELAATVAVLKTIGMEEFDRGFSAIQTSYSQMVESDSKLLLAVGQNCAAWMQEPSPHKFDKLVELYKLARQYVQEK
jgi:hypothetical protein